MANDTPASGTKEEKITIRDASGGKKEVDLSAFAAKLAPTLTDPADQFVATNVTRPDAAGETPGPHRYSIYVKKDDRTALNLGAPVGPFMPGISGLTNTSISWVADQGSRTGVSIGGHIGHGTFANWVDGFGAGTEGVALVMSKQTAMMWSTEADTRLLAGKDLVMLSGGMLSGQFAGGINLSTPKNLSITVGETPEVKATVGSVFGGIVALSADFLDPVGPAAGIGAVQATADGANLVSAAIGEFDGATQIRDFVIAKAGNMADKVLLHAATIISLIMTYKRLHKEGKAGKAGLQSSDGASLLIAAYAEDLKFYQDFSKKSEDANLSLKAVGTVEIGSDKSCAISAPNGVGISGFKSVDVSSLAVGIKGHKDASVFGGITASLKSLAGGVTVQSDLGGVTIGGAKEVKVTSEEGAVMLTAKADAQLTASGTTSVFGVRGAYFGAGDHSGFGVVAGHHALRLGYVSKASDFETAAISDAGPMIKIDTSRIVLQHQVAGASGKLEVAAGALTGESTKTSFTSVGNFSVSTKGKILLD